MTPTPFRFVETCNETFLRIFQHYEPPDSYLKEKSNGRLLGNDLIFCPFTIFEVQDEPNFVESK